MTITSDSSTRRTVLGPRVAPATRPRRVVRAHVYVPACAVVATGAGLIAIGWISHWGGASFTETLTSLRVVVIGPITLLVIAGLMVAERLWPAQQRSPFARGYRQDLLFTVLNATLTVPFVVALSLSFAEVVRHRLPWLTFPRMGWLPHGAAIALIFVAMDGFNWLAHLANHRVEMFWRFHEVHHSQEDMSVLTVFRTHPFVHVVYMVALIPGIVLIANGGLPTTLLVAYGAAVALAHSNLRLGFGPLERVFVSPNFHRIHHRVDGRQDVNLGFALTIWDQLFKSAIFPTAETVGLATGLPGRTLVDEHQGVRPRHLSVFLRQLAAPIRPKDSQPNRPSTTSSTTAPGP